ncbi:putative transcription factor interactor and regulator FHA-SMAD family [Rosa chinensis]|uniref:Putative transcription factor interactor and regulator FHA-SMAD family n=1 Tax=Rosa chinensis TaxID=74649 RepID=A0A2P6PDT3_ROSCH|nr:FHA domain-containing protein At4g14490 [Rosa chinensis]XP_024168953.1 FHA domain-containing protein At4g14490 [Rosa chinensis]XP_040365894.1 FHA domain-containing protein At4g14490 [Rosa chinensis]XP_040365895.1 FHA domain-containing protein At4g14490 [Rosa chinensis]XP_040365896.1 FHA domain-containing protein At4g14490 [Rosa chinensis]XP_040365897.1 FHA domain-containing protein At4g14490 [Rosa chinensis]PRQ20083.1 putative transcription factor interactor and regulator FHA-SMAD family [
MLDPLALKLELLKGPREGETLEYRPRSKVRIGRVVRGNNLAIRDSGISTNHLIIEFESGKWMIRDLGSSNGTIVNDTKLKPDTPLELNDGDEIKIGEYTSISVKIDGHERSRLRRNPRRGAVVENQGLRCRKEENSELEREGGEEIEVVEKPKRGRGRGRPRKARVLKSEVAVSEVSSRDVEAVVPDLETCSVQCGGRKRKNVQQVPLMCEKDNVVVAEKDSGEIGPVGVNGDKGDDCNVGVGGDKVESGSRSCFGVSGAKNVDKKGNGSGVKQGLGKIWQEPDLEKMTLDDWFDYVQVSLPKGVNDEIDKICAGMRDKAKLVQEYIAQHNKEKCHS